MKTRAEIYRENFNKYSEATQLKIFQLKNSNIHKTHEIHDLVVNSASEEEVLEKLSCFENKIKIF